MTTNVNPPLQPPSDVPLPLGLTPDEMWDLAVGFQRGAADFASFMENGPEIIKECRNRRTGHVCRLGRIELAAEGSEPDRVEYVLELDAGGIIVMADWSANMDLAGECAYIHQCASQTMVIWAALIGVRLGFGLTGNPYHLP